LVAAPPAKGRAILEDLGLLKAQIRQLLEGGPDRPAQAAEAALDLRDYHSLIEQGIDHELLAPHFRQWLHWRTSAAPLRQYLAQTYGAPAARMEGEGFAEWLWLAWSQTQGLLKEETKDTRRWNGPRMVGMVGPSGGGKTTTLAKLASICCHEQRQNAVIFTLDTFRVGATEQWRRYARLLGVALEEIASPQDIGPCMERWASADWIGIDTPGGMSPQSEPGRCYGSVLAQCPQMKTLLVLPAAYQEAICREQMRRGRAFKAGPVLFSKLDEMGRRGGIVNLTLSGEWKIEGFATGPRVPKDFEPISREALWRRVLAPPSEAMLSGGLQ
jgi:flagellar biosynthesis GTPase FlhF